MWTSGTTTSPLVFADNATFFDGNPKLTKLLRTLSAYFFTLLLFILVSPSFLPIGATATKPNCAFGFLSTVIPIASN